MLKLSKKFALPLIAVLLIGTGVGGYFLFKNFQIPKYFVDKYPELIEYCDTEQSENSLKVSCKALMLDIKPNVHNGTPSLTSLVITNDEELKEYIITEKEEVFAWTNDVLQYKKLKPIVINLQYVKKNPIQYSLQGITFENIPDTYIQEIVNRDIEEIMGMDRSSTTILNSFDFCPRPETLPDYVIKKEEYAKYWGENILTKLQYDDITLYNLDDSTIRMLFVCDSRNKTRKLSNCATYQNNLEVTTTEPLSNFSLKTDIDDSDRLVIKEISTFYDNLYLNKFFVDINQNTVIPNIHSKIADRPVNTTLLCAYYKTLKEIDPVTFEAPIKQIEEYIFKNIKDIKEPLCTRDLGQSTNKNGLYLFGFFSDYSTEFKLFNRCLNSTLIEN